MHGVMDTVYTQDTKPNECLRSALCRRRLHCFCTGRLPGVLGAPHVALEQLLCLLQRAVRLQSSQLHLQVKPFLLYLA